MLPVSPGTIKSGPQPTRLLTRQGHPHVIASFTTSPQVSPPFEGSTRASAAMYAFVISDWLRKPANRIGASWARTNVSHSDRNLPSPTIRPHKFAPPFAARSTALRKSIGRFFSVNFPTNKKTVRFPLRPQASLNSLRLGAHRADSDSK